MFTVGLYAGKPLSITCATALALSFFLVINLTAQVRQKLAYFIPTVWPEVARIATPDYGYYWLPSIPYMLTFLLAGILAMSSMILLKIGKVEFLWENEDI